MKKKNAAVQTWIRMARRIWSNLSPQALIRLREIVVPARLHIGAGDLIYLDNGWYVTNTGLLGLARRCRCAGIHVRPVSNFCDPSSQRWAFRATVYKSRDCRGFVGYGDANPSNVSPLVRGAEMRVAETRAVNRALRKAYGIGICSVEEIGSLPARISLEPNGSCRRSLLTARYGDRTPRPALPVDPPAPAGCFPGQAVCGRILRHQGPAAGHP